jgi:hypothetical protein
VRFPRQIVRTPRVVTKRHSGVIVASVKDDRDALERRFVLIMRDRILGDVPSQRRRISRIALNRIGLSGIDLGRRNDENQVAPPVDRDHDGPPKLMRYILAERRNLLDGPASSERKRHTRNGVYGVSKKRSPHTFVRRTPGAAATGEHLYSLEKNTPPRLLFDYLVRT